MNYKKLIISLLVPQLAGLIGSFFTAPAITSWYLFLEKPSFNPPSWIFGPVWVSLYFLIGISLYLVWSKNFTIKNTFLDSERKKPWNRFSKSLWTGDWKQKNIVIIFIIQLLLNALWSILFFGLHSPAMAFSEILMLWFAILYTIINFYRVSKWASYLLIPYLLWVSFAGVLNYFIWQLN